MDKEKEDGTSKHDNETGENMKDEDKIESSVDEQIDNTGINRK